MRTKPSHRGSRRDPSKFQVPAASQITADNIPGGITVTSTDLLILSPVPGDNPVTGITLNADLPVTFAEQTDPFTITLKLSEASTVVITAASILATMNGIRNNRGGGLVPGQLTF